MPDTARDRLGLNTWQELSASVEERLTAMSSSERGVFAAGTAERLMSWHEALPEEDRAPFTMGLRPLLNSVWEACLGDSTAFTAVKRGVAEYMLSEYCHNDGQDGPEDADDNAAAATLHAAHAYLFECCDFAVWASRRSVDAVDEHLEYLAEQEEDRSASRAETRVAEGLVPLGGWNLAAVRDGDSDAACARRWLQKCASPPSWCSAGRRGAAVAAVSGGAPSR
ncbi:hypothetical protein ACWFQ8_07300 [Streptomyces sp. NPDC055254]